MMFKTKTFTTLAILLIAALPLAAAGCIPSTPSAATATAAPTLASATDTPIVSATLSSTATPVAATLPPATATAPAAGVVIAPGNVANLTSTSAQMPDFTQSFVWPAAQQAIANTQSGLFPIQTQPLSVGAALNLNLPAGAQILSVAPDGSSAAVRRSDDSLALYDLQGNLLFEPGVNQPYFANYSPDSSLLAVGMTSQMAVQIFDLSTQQLVTTLTGFQSAAPVYGAAVAPGDQTLVYIARATVQYQNIASGDLGAKYGFQDFVLSQAFAPDGSAVALNVGPQIFIYSIPDGQQLTALTLSQPTRGLEYSPDGSLLAAAYGSSIQFWDTSNWTPLQPASAGSANILQISFAPDGKTLLSVDENKELRAWTVQ